MQQFGVAGETGALKLRAIDSALRGREERQARVVRHCSKERENFAGVQFGVMLRVQQKSEGRASHRFTAPTVDPGGCFRRKRVIPAERYQDEIRVGGIFGGFFQQGRNSERLEFPNDQAKIHAVSPVGENAVVKLEGAQTGIVIFIRDDDCEWLIGQRFPHFHTSKVEIGKARAQ